MIINLHSHAVRSRKFFYGTQQTVGIAFVGTLAECKAWVAASNSAIYYTSQNEAGRWSLKIVKTDSLSRHARTEAAHKQMEQMPPISEEIAAFYDSRRLTEEDVDHMAELHSEGRTYNRNSLRSSHE
jgi:hypothetical protein